MTALLLLVLSALADPVASEPAPASPARWVGTSVSGGGEPLRITVSEAQDEGRLVEVFWPSFEKTTLEAVTPTTTACDLEELAPGRARMDSVDRCFSARLPDRHPTYDYEDKTRVRCVFGTRDNEPAVACKLQYSGWFVLKRG